MPSGSLPLASQSSPPPTPFHILRTHQSPLSALSFNPTNTLLYSADQAGHISVTDLRSRRLVSYWKSHDDGVLGLEEWDGRLIRCVFPLTQVLLG